MTYSQLFYEEAIVESTKAVEGFTEKLKTTEGFIAEFAISDPKIAQGYRHWKTLYQEKLDFFQSRLTELQSGFERHYGVDDIQELLQGRGDVDKINESYFGKHLICGVL